MNIPEGIKELVTDEEPDLEHRKAADFYARWEYTLTQEDRDEYGDESWDEFIGLSIHAYGIWNDNWGSEVYDWSVYRPVEKESQASHDFKSLLSHLNSEDNEMALKFAAKYFPPEVVYEKVVEPSPEGEAPVAKVVSGD